LLDEWCKKVHKAYLKPGQKVDILIENLIPKLLFGLSLTDPVKAILQEVDSTIRSWVKRWLHLPECTSSHFLYTAKLDGGLSVPKLEAIIPRMVYNNWRKLLNSEEAICKIAHNTDIKLKRQRCDEVFKVLDSDCRDKELKLWHAQKVQGAGATSYMSKGEKTAVANLWMKHRKVLSNREYIEAIRLRTNTFPTKVSANRGKRRITADVRCRHCKAPAETICISYVLAHGHWICA
jgi:hypothetical protein